jgi:hypothetical protein
MTKQQILKRAYAGWLLRVVQILGCVFTIYLTSVAVHAGMKYQKTQHAAWRAKYIEDNTHIEGSTCTFSPAMRVWNKGAVQLLPE